jgi:hypothetical protein
MHATCIKDNNIIYIRRVHSSLDKLENKLIQKLSREVQVFIYQS